MLVYVAAILDPHSKFLVVELTLCDMYGIEKGKKLGSHVKDYTYKLFDEYRMMYSSYMPESGNNGDPMSLDEINDGDYKKNLFDRAKRLKETTRYVNSELDRYINDQLGPLEEEMDALTWWGNNGYRYPTLQRMARDILAIPLSTVASESAFSTGGRHLDPFRSSLSPLVMSLHLFNWKI